MKNKQPERKLSTSIGLTRHLIGGVLCLAAISLICARASAQNLFAVNVDWIDEFTPNGVQSNFATGLNNPHGLAFDKAGNLFVADTGTYTGTGAVYKFTPAGVRTTFASGLNFPFALAFDSQGNLFVAADETIIYKFTPTGARTTFATGLFASGLAFDRAGNLFVAAGFSFAKNEKAGTVYKFTPTGARTTFASGLNSPFALAFDSQGNLFVADQGYGYDFLYDAAVYKFTPSGLRSRVASENDQVSVIPGGLTIDGADNLFVSDYGVSGNIFKFNPSGVGTIFAAGSYVTALAFQPTQTPTPLVNISTRGSVETGSRVTIAGFIITGTAWKQVVVRGLGPSLTQSGVSGVLADPILQLIDGSGKTIFINDNWKETQQAGIQATGLAPSNDAESAIRIALQPGNYTAILSGTNNTTGVGLVEVYDIETAVSAELTNASTRGFVGTDQNVMIGGFITAGGNGSTQVVVRGLGPTLTQFGVSGALADPALTVVDGNGNIVRSNNNWKDTQEAAIQATGKAPPNDLEAAILTTVSPGNYTAILSGNGGGTGIGLVDVYKL